MRGFRILVIVFLVYSVYGALVVFKGSESGIRGSPGRPWVVIYADGRYWLVDEKGWIVDVAGIDDMRVHPIVQDVKLEGLRLEDGDIEILKRLEGILNDPRLSTLSVGGKYVITVKGMVIYFQRWEDIEKHFHEIVEKLVYFSPKMRFFLRGDKLVVLRGD